MVPAYKFNANSLRHKKWALMIQYSINFLPVFTIQLFFLDFLGF